MNIAKWRNKYMRFYFTQFEANLENATSYILSKTNLNSSSIFFMIADENFKIVGHIGISNIFEDSAELDNILLGEKTDIPNLMIDVENQVLNWIKDYLGIRKIILQLFSFNFLAINLHNECGFKVLESTPLRKVDYLSKIKFEPCGKSESDLNFTCITMVKKFTVD
jgi:RimJ/RimL family protein N-acetyltransferase